MEKTLDDVLNENRPLFNHLFFTKLVEKYNSNPDFINYLKVIRELIDVEDNLPWIVNPNIQEPKVVLPVRTNTLSGILTSGYGPRGDAFHSGIDIAVDEGTAVYAVASGKVTLNEFQSGYGNLIEIEHDKSFNPKYTAYAHLQSPPAFKVGDAVALGASIASSGNTGTRSSGPHLHFEVRKSSGKTGEENTVNPIEWLKKYGALK